uniref:Translin-associated protein X n=1 Tax=Anopheles minimus TaxID=112268 RepID=A0A182W3N6_9DIPT
MSAYRGNKRQHFGKGSGRRGRDQDNAAVDENNPVIQCFREYATILDAKHDKYERIVKIGRDITIESKRIIFLLHTIDPRQVKNNVRKVCEEAKERLEAIFRNHFINIAKELKDQDPYQYSRAYTNGMQEFIEAYTFYEYSCGQDISNWESIQKKLTYETTLQETPTVARSMKEQGGMEVVSSDGGLETSAIPTTAPNNAEQPLKMACLLNPQDFVLGLGDLSGEIMRTCVNSLGSGNSESCFQHCRFMQELYKGFLSVTAIRSRDFSHKMITLRQSLLKSENVCYNVTVRGGEAAKWGTTEDAAGALFQLQLSKDDDDEGRYLPIGRDQQFTLVCFCVVCSFWFSPLLTVRLMLNCEILSRWRHPRPLLAVRQVVPPLSTDLGPTVVGGTDGCEVPLPCPRLFEVRAVRQVVPPLSTDLGPWLVVLMAARFRCLVLACSRCGPSPGLMVRLALAGWLAADVLLSWLIGWLVVDVGWFVGWLAGSLAAVADRKRVSMRRIGLPLSFLPCASCLV